MAFMCFDYILLNFNERTVVNASLCWKPLCCTSNIWLEIIFYRNRYHWSSVQIECACSEVHAICDHWGTDRLSFIRLSKHKWNGPSIMNFPENLYTYFNQKLCSTNRQVILWQPHKHGYHVHSFVFYIHSSQSCKKLHIIYGFCILFNVNKYFIDIASCEQNCTCTGHTYVSIELTSIIRTAVQIGLGCAILWAL